MTLYSTGIQKFFYLILLVILLQPLNCFGRDLSPLRGEPFTDPSLLTEMPDEWHQQPIQHVTGSEQADLVVTLDQHLYPVLLPIIRAFADKRGVRIATHEGTCGISAGLLSRKQVDIGGFCCPPGKTDRLPGLSFHTLGISALGILVHPDNPVSDLSSQDVRQIFQGKIFRWSELQLVNDSKGPNKLIRPIGRLHCKQRPGHWRLLLDNEDLFSPRMEEVGTIRDMISHVAVYKWNIGYEVLWNIERYMEEGKVKYITLDKASPTSLEDVITLRYPFYRTYDITSWKTEHLRNTLADDLVRHLLEHAEQIDKVHNIIPAARLKEAGWKFKGNELVGEPE